jgi:hypothetical protein
MDLRYMPSLRRGSFHDLIAKSRNSFPGLH